MVKHRESSQEWRSNAVVAALSKHSPLFRLPTDVWLHIFAQLSPDRAPTFAALSSTCRRILALVDEYGWKEILSNQYRFVNPDHLHAYYQRYKSNMTRARTLKGRQNAALVRSQWWFACRYASLLRRCWFEPALCSGSIDIPAANAQNKIAGGGGAKRRRFGTDFAIPTLTVGSKYIIVGVRSELFLYHIRRPTSEKPTELLARIKLNSRPDDPRQEQEAGPSNGTVLDDPWQDITAVQEMDEEGGVIVVGYADGCVQLLSLTMSGNSKEAKRVEAGMALLQHFPCWRRQEIVGISVYSSARLKPPSSSTNSSAERVKVASLSKRGHLRIHYFPPSSKGAGEVQTWSWHIDNEGIATRSSAVDDADVSAESSGTTTPRPLFRSAAFNNAPLVSPLDGLAGSATRAWSVLFGSSTDDASRAPSSSKREKDQWVAVGITAEHAVYIYPLMHDASGDVRLEEPFHVASTGQRTSVYAMSTAPPASPIPPYLLFVGFYDGVVRVYDTRQLKKAHEDGEGAMNMHILDDALVSNGTGAHRCPRPRRMQRELNPIAVFREDYDHDAIYSLSFGGPSATLLVVGGARHAKVRVFDVSMLVDYDVPLLSPPPPSTDGKDGQEEQCGDWTAFALPSTDSPVYGIVGQGDMVIGVTDRKIWWFDLSASILDTDSQTTEHSKPVAYFRHRDGILSYSQASLHPSH